MTAHLHIAQLRFARQKWLLGLEGITPEEATRPFGKMNCISWMIGHLACFEQLIWLEMTQDQTVSEAVHACGFGKPASTPPLVEMQSAWTAIITEADRFLDTLTDDDLGRKPVHNGRPWRENIGTYLLRHTWHYWYHLGEQQAIRQVLGHTDLPQFVGRMDPAVMFPDEAMGQ